MNDRVDTGTVGQPRVHERGRLVDPATDVSDDLVDDATQMHLVDEANVGLLELAVPFAEHLERAVHHDLGDLWVVQQRVDRTIAEDIVGDLVE
ncbi:hypothetical protein BMS3Bbin01_03052 [bacterium BMS3Bbin01]|nr:hypothetical protein BMS3Bbin01_03052 [bacterium BMS3Bbin01]